MVPSLAKWIGLGPGDELRQAKWGAWASLLRPMRDNSHSNSLMTFDLTPRPPSSSPHTLPSGHKAFSFLGHLAQRRQHFWFWVEQRSHQQVKCCHWHLRLSLKRVLRRTALFVIPRFGCFPSNCGFGSAWGLLAPPPCLSLELNDVARLTFQLICRRAKENCGYLSWGQLSSRSADGEAILTCTSYCF